MTSSPVVAPHTGVRQTGIARQVDSVKVGVELSGAATAATEGHIAAQNCCDGVQRCGAVHGQLQWCIMGRKRVMEAEVDNLDTELDNSCGRRMEVEVRKSGGGDGRSG